MIPNKISKLILRDLIFVGVPFILARKLEKYVLIMNQNIKFHF